MIIHRQLVGFASSIFGLQKVSPSVLHGIMKHMKASDRQNILNFATGVEHRNMVDLLKILEEHHKVAVVTYIFFVTCSV